MFEAYKMTAKLDMMYAGIAEYIDLLLFSEHQRLLTGNLSRGPRTVAKQTRICEEALNNFALSTWPNNRLASLKFQITWRQCLTKVAFRITSVEQLQKELLPGYFLHFSSLGIYTDELVNIIVMFVRPLIVLIPSTAPP